MALQVMQSAGKKVYPLYNQGQDAVELQFNVTPGVTITGGTVVGLTTTAGNDVQTITTTGTPTSGTSTWNWVHPLNGNAFSFTLAYNSTSTAAQTALNTAMAAVGNTAGSGGTNLITVSGGALPGTPLVFTASGDATSRPLQVMTAASNTLNAGATIAVAHTTTGATADAIAVYDNSTIAVATGICGYDISTDGAGRVTFGTGALGGEHQETFLTAPIYVKGYFATKDLIGLDSGAVTDLGHLVSGTTTDGILRIE